MKKLVNYRLSEEALEAIGRISKATGLSATAVIEMTVREAARRENVAALQAKPIDVDDEPDPERETAARQADRKAARAERKTELAESVTAALRPPEQVRTYCPFHRPKWCEPTCNHRVAM